jgi:CheY-like chemotaxis protein
MDRASAGEPATKAILTDPDAPAEHTPTRGLILVAEDDPISQLFLQHQLLRFGYAADLVSDGAEALAAYASGDYRLILTDCHMPEMDGFALARAIRERERGTDRRLAIVAIAANVEQAETDRCLAAGMDDVFFKPVRVETVGAMLERWLPADAAAAAPDDPRRTSFSPATIADTGDECAHPIDMAMLAQLLGTDDDAYLKEMIGVYWDTVRDTPRELAALIAAADAPTLRDAAHATKGASTSVGATPLSSLLKELQLAASAADWNRIAALMPRIESAFTDLQQFVGTLKAT